MSRSNQNRFKVPVKSGFTLVEMMVIAPIVILLIGTFIFAIVQLTGDSLADRGKSMLLNSIQSSLKEMEDDTRSSAAFLSTNNVPLVTPQGYDNGIQNFTNTSATNDALILNAFATTESPASPTRGLVYLANMPNACGSANINQNQVMTSNIVYFVKNNTLWRRTLLVNNYASKDCSGTTIWQRPSCAPGITGTMCETQDEKLVTGIPNGGFTVNYYTSPSDATNVAAARSGTDTARQNAMDSTATIEVTITATATTSGRDYTQQATMRITRVGSLVKYATPS